MKFTLKYICFLSFIICIAACSDDNSIDKDLDKPTITINYNEGFSQGCTELSRGEAYNFRAQVTDNKELASYSIDIHHNFDHHTHDDQGVQCDLEAIKTAVNPLIFMENYSVEDGVMTHEINISITIPNDIDPGDYHCAYSVTDVTGWQSRTSVDIKII